MEVELSARQCEMERMKKVVQKGGKSEIESKNGIGLLLNLAK